MDLEQHKRYPSEPGWYCLGFDRMDPAEQADLGPHLEGIYQFTGEQWLDEHGEKVQDIYDPSLFLQVAITAADYYVKQA